MQIVIDIPEEVKHKVYACGLSLCPSDKEQLIHAIMNGTPLPKGHGRLIDADEFHRTLEDMPIRDTDKWFNWLQKACNRLAEAPTIIETDKEQE